MIITSIIELNQEKLTQMLTRSPSPIDVTLQHPLPTQQELDDFSKPLNLKTSPLKLACVTNNPEMVAILLDNVNFNIAEQKKRVLEIFKESVHSGKDEIVEVFLKSNKIDLFEKSESNDSLGISLLRKEYGNICQGKENLRGTFKCLTPLIDRRKKTMVKITQILNLKPQSDEANEARYYEELFSQI